MEVIYYCSKCDGTFGGKENFIIYCPKCSANNLKVKLIETDIRRDFWRSLNDHDKEEHKKIFRESFSNLGEEAKKKALDASLINDTYEYEVIELVDNHDGSSNALQIKAEINKMASMNWRLVSVTTNEAGKNSIMLGIGGISSGTNATIDSTILIFERRVKKAG